MVSPGRPPGGKMSCRLDISLGPSCRDPSLEADLQARLDAGHRIFAVGDIHGHFATFRALVHRLDLSQDDRIVCLGDMIDRGPDSAGLVEMIRGDERIVCIKGNHEQMALNSITEHGEVELWQPWMKRGGKSTWGSYIVRAKGDLWRAKSNFFSDAMWLDALPTQIVLDNIRLVHAGYDPRMPLDSQGEKELLWIRKRWYQHDKPVDPERLVLFGHSTTTKVGKNAGQVAFSTFQLDDGRPAWVAMDVGAYNHVSPGLAAFDVSTLKVTKQPTLRSERWFEPSNMELGRQRKKKYWRQEGGRKEAWVAEHYGLAVLQASHRKEHMTEKKARRRLRMAGVVLSPEDQSFSHLEKRTNEITKEDTKKHPQKLEWVHQGKRIRLGPGTEVERFPPHLPGPTGFRVHSRSVAYSAGMYSSSFPKKDNKRDGRRKIRS